LRAGEDGISRAFRGQARRADETLAGSSTIQGRPGALALAVPPVGQPIRGKAHVRLRASNLIASAREPMTCFRALLVHSALFGVTSTLLGAGCYAERLPPPAYRYACDADNDCSDPERCIDSLCQIPCTYETFADDCPEAGGYLFCVNGTCSTGCELGSDECPNSQQCLDIGIPEDQGGGGFFGGSTGPLGVCTVPCGETTCPSGQICVAGACAFPCVNDMCPPGLECYQRLVCIPPALLPEGAESSDSGTSAESGTASESSTSAADTSTSAGPGDESTTGGPGGTGLTR
jgi:hypothetical protein